MKHVIGTFGTLFVLLLNIFTGVAIITVSGNVTAAKEYKAAVAAEIENSNFNPNVIQGCITQASFMGYGLQVTNCLYDEEHNMQTAEIILTYDYKIPIFGISETKTTRGIAR